MPLARGRVSTSCRCATMGAAALGQAFAVDVTEVAFQWRSRWNLVTNYLTAVAELCTWGPWASAITPGGAGN